MADQRTLYNLLGIARTATQTQVRSAHRALARTLHPDVNPAKDAADRFGLVQRAYEVLIDPAKRAAYDRQLDAGDLPEVSVVLSPTYSWTNVAGATAALRQVAREEMEEEVDELWRVFFEPRVRARGNGAS